MVRLLRAEMQLTIDNGQLTVMGKQSESIGKADTTTVNCQLSTLKKEQLALLLF